MRWLLPSVVAWAALLGPPEGICAGEVTTGTALEILGEAPPAPPPGYESTAEVLRALGSGAIPVVNLLQKRGGVQVQQGIEYGRAGDRPLKMDVFSPLQVDAPLPAIVFIHGGGWRGGRKEDYRLYGEMFATKGYVVASIDYRLSGEAKFPAAVEDAKCAVRWMRANAADWNVDPDRIGVAGGSAGGHLALMVGLSSDVRELEGNGGHPETSSRVQCVVDLYGPTDLTTQFARGKSGEGGLLERFLGATYEEDPERYRLASPINYVTPDDPPVLILHGTIDETVPIDQSNLLANRLAQVGVPYIYDRLPGWPHAMDLSLDVNRRCVWFMERFFAHYLKRPGEGDAEEGR